jgi:hypothetical protein
LPPRPPATSAIRPPRFTPPWRRASRSGDGALACASPGRPAAPGLLRLDHRPGRPGRGAAPFTQPAPLASKVFTAVINVVVGIAVISLLSGVGRSAVRPARDRVHAPAPLNRWLPATHRVRGTGPPRPAEGGTLGLDQAAPDPVPPDGPVPHRELQAFSAYRAQLERGSAAIAALPPSV